MLMGVGAQSSTATNFPPCTLSTHSPPPYLLGIARCSKKISFLVHFQDKEWCRGCGDKFQRQVRALSQTVRLDKGWPVRGNDRLSLCKLLTRQCLAGPVKLTRDLSLSLCPPTLDLHRRRATCETVDKVCRAHRTSHFVGGVISLLLPA